MIVARTEEKLNENLPEADVLVCSNSNFRAEWLHKASGLKLIHAMSAGVERILPFIPDKVILANAKGVHAINIAEQVLGYMLMFERRLLRTLKAQAAGKWMSDELRADSPDAPGELNGKTAMVFGLGRVGRRIAELCKCIGMKVVAVKRNPSDKPRFVDSLHSFEDFDRALKEADYVVAALPDTQETRNMFSKSRFACMKKSAFFINVGRGSLVSERDLVDSLNEGLIAGAALDVFETEPLPGSSELWNMENVIITPHSSGSTPKYMDRFADILCSSLKAFANNEPLPNHVDRKKGY